MRRLFVLELNEIPLRVFRWHAERHPASATARLLAQSSVGESIAREELPRDLYPSQSWASLATGVPFTDHGVFWYGDDKPAEFPLYWQAAATAGRSVGIVGTLHSSPLSVQLPAGDVRFALPDSFASDADTVPASLRSLQSANLAMTSQNSRAVTDSSPLSSYLRLAKALASSGVSARALAPLGRLAIEVATHRVPKERLRSGQFHLMADQFDRLSRSTDPDLCVLFSNHVASAMHRYWFTAFPQDWDEPIYDDLWVERFEDELPYALRSLDRWLDRWMRWAQDTDRTLVVLSSMGQTGGAAVDVDQTHALVLRNPELFAEALGLRGQFEVASSMVPQITYLLKDEPSAVAATEDLGATDGSIRIDRRGKAVTVDYSGLDAEDEKVQLGGALYTVAEAGFELIEVNEHRAAIHDPIGSIIVYNSPTAHVPTEPTDYLTIAPAILEALGVDPLPHHTKSGLTL